MASFAKGGRDGRASDDVRDLERRAALASLQSAITEGVASGPPQPLDMANFKRRTRQVPDLG